MPTPHNVANAFARPFINALQRRRLTPLEVAIPAAQRSVHLGHYLLNAARPIARRLPSQPFPELELALLPGPLLSTVLTILLEVISQEVEPAPFGGVHDARLFRMES